MVETKILRASVMTSKEWYKLDERDPDEWKCVRQQVLQRDEYTCSYCRLICKKFMQVNHIGAEDDHRLENLETVCPACHSVMHMGINSMQGILTIFDCKPEVTNMAQIVCVTRALVAKNTPWKTIEDEIYRRFACPDGRDYEDKSIMFANNMLQSIKPPDFRGYLPQGYAVMFHEQGPWNDFPESKWKWQCLPGSRYRK